MNLKGNLTSKGLQGSIGKSRMQGILGTNPAAIPITVDNALSLSSTNPVQNRVITAAITNRLWSDEVKAALLQIVEKVAYIDDQGQDYYDALYDALYPPVGLDSISAVFDAGGATIYNTDTLDDLKPYLTVTAYYTDGTSETVTTYTLSGSMDAGTQTITVSYGGKTTTFTVTVVALEVESVDAVFTQGSATIYDTDSLDTLRQYLVVTATYSDTTTDVVSDYTLSGSLTAGTSTITVSYGGKTDTVNVTVTDYIRSIVFEANAWARNGYQSYAEYVKPNTVAARARCTVPIVNHGYVFTVTDSTKYNLVVYNITSNETQRVLISKNTYEYCYPGESNQKSWVTSDSSISDYALICLKKMDNTEFTSAELENGAEAVFTYTKS